MFLKRDAGRIGWQVIKLTHSDVFTAWSSSETHDRPQCNSHISEYLWLAVFESYLFSLTPAATVNAITAAVSSDVNSFLAVGMYPVTVHSELLHQTYIFFYSAAVLSDWNPAANANR